MVTMFLCDNCKGHEFVVFTGAWNVPQLGRAEAPIYAACANCGYSWNIDNARWIDDDNTPKTDH